MPLPGPVTRQLTPQLLFATEPLAQALRQLEHYGPDGLPVISDDGQYLQGWLTSHNIFQAVAHQIRAAQRSSGPPPADPILPGPGCPAGGTGLLEATRCLRSPSRPVPPPSASARRRHLAARSHRGLGPGHPHPARPRPRHHPGPRRPRQPARSRSTQSRAIRPAQGSGQPARRASRRCATGGAGTASRRRRPAPVAGSVMPDNGRACALM